MRLQFLSFLLGFCLFAACSPVELQERNVCANKPYSTIVALLRGFPQSALICDIILRRSPPGTVTAYTTVTSTITSTTTLEGTISSTVTGAEVTTTTTDTITDTSYSTTVSTATSTATVTSTTTYSTSTFVISSTVTPPTTTTTTTSYSHVTAVNAKRAAPSQLGNIYSGCPQSLKSVLIRDASTACSCLGPRATPTVTATKTESTTVVSTIDNKSTETITAPGATITASETTTVTTVVPTTAFTTETTTATVTSSVVATTTSTTTVTAAAPVATATQTVRTQYRIVSGPGTRCTYNEYTRYEFISNNGATNNYEAGKQECLNLCDRDTNCKFAFFYRSDPAFRNQGDTSAYCIINNRSYNPSQFLQCNVPFVLYYTGFEKV